MSPKSCPSRRQKGFKTFELSLQVCVTCELDIIYFSLDDQFNWSWQKIHATTGNQFPNVLCVLDLVLTLAPTRCPMTERGESQILCSKQKTN